MADARLRVERAFLVVGLVVGFAVHGVAGPFGRLPIALAMVLGVAAYHAGRRGRRLEVALDALFPVLAFLQDLPLPRGLLALLAALASAANLGLLGWDAVRGLGRAESRSQERRVARHLSDLEGLVADAPGRKPEAPRRASLPPT